MTAAEHLTAVLSLLSVEARKAHERAPTSTRPYLDLERAEQCARAAATILEIRDRLFPPTPTGPTDPAKPSPLSPSGDPTHDHQDHP